MPTTSTPTSSKLMVTQRHAYQPAASDERDRRHDVDDAASADSVNATGASSKRSMIWKTERPVAASARIAVDGDEHAADARCGAAAVRDSARSE